ncbi:hypothetical protein NXX18_20635 [Bacteroides fragilis]|nr:hypothetical protein [Bacteroides fragilis]
MIGRANRIIEAAESGKLTDKEEAADIIAQYAAEAKVARAMAHLIWYVYTVKHIQPLMLPTLWVFHWLPQY